MPSTLPNPVGYSNISWPPNELSPALETVSALGYQGVQLLGWVRETYAGGKTALKCVRQYARIRRIILAATKTL